MIDRKELREAYRNANAARRAVGRALRRKNTYRGAAKELLWSAVNLAAYPAGVLKEARGEPDDAAGSDGRFSRALPLRYLDPEAAATPIVLIHGYFHNRSAFLMMRRALRRAGFRSVTTLNYKALGSDVEGLAGVLGAHVDRVLAETGATRVHLIGHSLGGLVARAYVQLRDGAEKVHTCITLGTPHGGTYAAFAGRGKAARDLRPGSPLLRRLRKAGPSPARFVSYYSNLDAMVIPASNAKIDAPGLHARNVLVKDLGHASLLISQTLMRSVIDVLRGLDEQPEATVTPLPRTRSRASRRSVEGAS